MNTNERYELNKNLAQMLKGGVIMDVTTPEQAKIAEAAGACAVMALERIPADIRAAGGVSRMSDPKMIRGIQEAVSIPVMAKCRIGHFAEAQVLQAIEIDYIDESEVLSPADDVYHINKRDFDVPFVCGAKDLGEAYVPNPVCFSFYLQHFYSLLCLCRSFINTVHFILCSSICIDTVYYSFNSHPYCYILKNLNDTSLISKWCFLKN